MVREELGWGHREMLELREREREERVREGERGVRMGT